MSTAAEAPAATDPFADYPPIDHLDRANVILRIRLALRKRSGKDWGVTGGRGTAYGWLRISAPPRRMQGATGRMQGATGRVGATFGAMTMADGRELSALLGEGVIVSASGVSVPDSHDHYREYIDRAEGRAPRVVGAVTWD